jgi:hypothetical protein
MAQLPEQFHQPKQIRSFDQIETSHTMNPSIETYVPFSNDLAVLVSLLMNECCKVGAA